MKKYRSVFRFGVLLLSLCCLLSSMISCSGDGQSGEDTTVTESDTEMDDGKTKIVYNGSSTYTLVYPDTASSTVKTEMNRFIQAISDAIGVTLETKTDYLKRGALHDASAPEILFGRTNYDETEEALRGLENDQFVIRQVNNKIVIASPSDNNLEAAVTYFCDVLIPENTVTGTNGKKTLYLQEYTSAHQDTEQGVMIGEIPLSDYTIVYETERDGYAEVAGRLCDMIRDHFGVTLPLYADNRHEENGAEILIGKTNRSFSASVYAERSPQLMTYEVIVRQNKLQIVCGGPYSARECVDYLRFALSSLKTDGEYFATDLAPSTAERATGTDLRIMTSNVLAARWGEDSNTEAALLTPPVSQRVEIFAAVLADYQPDVIGMQEGDQKWIDQLPVYLELLKRDYGIEYTWVFPTYEGVQNLTSILYRSDKYDLIASDIQVNSYWNVSQKNYHMRLYAWAKFREKATPANEFILLNTHWAHESAEWIEKSVSEEIALLNSLRTQHGVPVFCTGDFNSKQDSAEYNRFMNETGVADLCRQAEKIGALINQCGGCGTVGSPRSGGNYIDHIFGVGAYTALRYETIVGNQIQWLSDHAPHIADIKLN